jgi:hypothetical protein
MCIHRHLCEAANQMDKPSYHKTSVSCVVAVLSVGTHYLSLIYVIMTEIEKID